MDKHPGQLTVPAGTVRELVDEQFPHWRHLVIRAVDAEGTVNAIFRIGGQLAARFALEPGEAEAMGRRLRREAEACRELAGRTRFPTPEPVAIGAPGRVIRFRGWSRVFVTEDATAVSGVTVGVYLFRNAAPPESAP